MILECKQGVLSGSRYDLSISETDTGILCLVLELIFFKACRKTADSSVKSPMVI